MTGRMSPALLSLDLLVLVIGLPLVWTLRDLAPHGLRTAGGLSLLARGGAVFDGRGSPLAEPDEIADPTAGIFFKQS